MADASHHDPTVGNPVPAGTPGPVPPAGAGGLATPPVPRRRRRNRAAGTAPHGPIAELYPAPAEPEKPVGQPIPIRTVDEARALARGRFRERVQAGEKVGECDCHSSDTSAASGPVAAEQGPSARVAGVRFRDSGRLYYFDAVQFALEPGDWVVVDTERGQEAGRVIVAPHQLLLNQLQGDLRPVRRRLSDDDVELMDRLKRESASAVRTFSDLIREHRVPVKPISASFSFDGSLLTLSYAPHQGIERPDLRALGRDLARTFGCRVDLRAVSPREEARLLGGLGRCGRTLCCSSWLPVFPEITMGMAKTQDLALNPSKVSGVCGRLLCCLSYENEQYKQLKSVLPRLGQRVETPEGPGQVVSLQILKELVTVRLEQSGEHKTLPSGDLGQRAVTVAEAPAPGVVSAPVVHAAPVAPAPARVVEPTPAAAPDMAALTELARRATAPYVPVDGEPAGEEASRRRRRRRTRGAGDASA